MYGNRFFSFLAGIFLLSVAVSCSDRYIVPSGPVISKSYGINPNTSMLNVSGGVDVEVYSGTPDDMFIVTANENIHDYLEINQRHGELSVEVSSGNIAIRNLSVKIAVPDGVFERFVLQGASALVADTPLEASRIELQLSGASTASCDIAAQDIYMDAVGSSAYAGSVSFSRMFAKFSGASRAQISGSGSYLDLNCSGASRFLGFPLTCNELDIINSQSSRVEITVNDKIYGENSGGSVIYYKGNPSKIILENSGGSKVIDAN